MKRKTRNIFMILIISLLLITITSLVSLNDTEVYQTSIISGLITGTNDIGSKEEMYKKKIKENPNDAEAYIKLGWIYREQGRFGEAEEMFGEAEEMLKKAIEINPDEDQLYIKLGFFYKEYGRLEESEEMLKKAIEINPNNYDAYIEISRNYNEQDKPEEVVKVLKKAIEINPDKYEAYMQLGMIYFEQNRFGEAEEMFGEAEEMLKKAIEINPNDDLTYTELGIIYQLQNRFGEAEEMLKKAIEINPKSGKAKEKLGRVYIERNEYSKAEEILGESIKNDPHNGCAFQALGILYTTLNRTNKAIENYKTLADKGPHARYSHRLVAELCFNSGDYYCALDYINKAIKLNNHPTNQPIKGYTLLMLRKYEEAEKIFKDLDTGESRLYALSGFGHIAIINKDYQTAEKHFLTIISNLDRNESSFYGVVYEMTYLGLGWVYANQNKHVDALKNYESVLRHSPTHLLGLISKGNSLLELGFLDDALEAFNRAAEFYPDNEYIIAERGLVEYNKGDYASAEASFKKALVRNDETYSCPYEGLGLVYFKQGKFNEAKHNLEKSISINPDIQYLKYNALAKIYIQEGKLDEARVLLEKSIENYPYDNEAQQLLDEL